MPRHLAPILLLACLPSIARAQGDSPRTAQRDTTPLTLPTLEVKGAAGRPTSPRRPAPPPRPSTPLRDVPQSVTVVTKNVIADQRMQSMADVVRYIPGVTMAQGEGNRDQATIRGNNTTAGFFVDGMRDDVQYFRDLYNVERVEALKGANALIFGRGVGGGALNRVTKAAEWTPTRELQLAGRLLRQPAHRAGRGAGRVGAAGAPAERDVRELRPLSRRGGPRALRHQPDRYAPLSPGPGCWRATSTSRTTAPPTGAFPRSRAAPLDHGRRAPSSATRP